MGDTNKQEGGFAMSDVPPPPPPPPVGAAAVSAPPAGVVPPVAVAPSSQSPVISASAPILAVQASSISDRSSSPSALIAAAAGGGGLGSAHHPPLPSAPALSIFAPTSLASSISFAGFSQPQQQVQAPQQQQQQPSLVSMHAETSPMSVEGAAAGGGTSMVEHDQSSNGQAPPQSASPGTQAANEGRVLKVEDALTYLDEVKRQFGDQPHIYNMFLEIMKSFKAETIDTPGVIQKVSELFRGHNNLILGFNTFLPPGYRIENADLGPDNDQQHIVIGPGMAYAGSHQAMAALQAQQQHHLMQAQQHAAMHGQMLGPGGVPMLDNPFFMGGAQYFGGPPEPHQFMMMMGNPDLQQQQQMQQQQQAGGQAGQPGQPVEFDHAISYVTRIKRRFANDAETYKAFLDILHTYQKEQKSIKEVMDQVSELFKDHSDLLKEFTYFLPDGVREKAKQEITKINNRRRKEEQRKNDKNLQVSAAGSKTLSGGAIGLKHSGKGGEGKTLSATALPAPMSQKNATSPLGVHRRGGGGGDDDMDEINDKSDSRTDNVKVSLGKVPRLERQLFSQIKKQLGTRERWAEFLKCLELFSQEILSRQELIAICTDMFASNVELLEEFDRLLASRGATDDPTEDAWFSIPLSDIDFSQSRRATPSYRSLPPNYPKPPCSERTALCRMVLNDTWVAVPTGSEDFSFKSMRKNQYEEALFKCEDDRYELDMVIDSNLSTIYALEPLALEIEASQQQHHEGQDSSIPPPRFQLDKRTLSVINLKAIARVYGERSAEMFELLRKSPASAIPTILSRLKSKDQEWRRQRDKLNEGWKDVLEKNYIKSLDHRSFYFKQNEKKLITAKTMISEAKDAPERQISLSFPDAFAHRNACALITMSAEKNMSKQDFDRCIPALEKIVSKLVGVKSFGGKSLTSTKVGTKVLSRYGLGTISGGNTSLVEVKLITGGAVVKVPKDELFEAAPFNPKEMAATGPSSSTSLEQVYIGQTGYLMLRFYHILCDRLARAEAVCAVVEKDQTTQIKHVMERNGMDEEPHQLQSEGGLFAKCMDLIKQFVRGQIDGNKFEDEAYSLVGPHAYFLFTIDKLLNMVVRSVQGMVNEDRSLKVMDTLAKYQEKKTAANAAEFYRASSEALVVGNAAAAARLKFVPGAGPFAPPSKKLADAVSDTSQSASDVVLAAVDTLWEAPPKVVIEFLEAIPQNATFATSTGSRSLSPTGFDADGVPIVVEMGELEFAVPVKMDLKSKTSSMESSSDQSPTKSKKLAETTSPSIVPTTTTTSATTTALNGGSDTALIVISAFTVEKLPGSDDVLRRVNAFKQDAGATGEWWKSTNNQVERTLSPAPGEESTSSNEDGPPPGGAKRMRGGAEEQTE